MLKYNTEFCKNCINIIETMVLQNHSYILFAATWFTSQTQFL